MLSEKLSEVSMEQIRPSTGPRKSAPLPAVPMGIPDSMLGDDAEPFSMSWQDFRANNFYISGGWDLEYYTSIRGCENFHIYLWVAKDLAWTQDWQVPAMLFGTMALCWCGVLAYHAISAGIWEEMYMLIALVMWLAGNYMWMAGEVITDDDSYVAPRTAIIMETAISWILFLHLVLKPFKIMPDPKYEETIYCRPGLTPRFSYFASWRQYEHAHTLCWLGKDLSWNRYNPYFWGICFVPTLLIAADFIWVSFRTKRMMEDCVHYTAQLIWVLGNMLWAIGNVFVNNTDDNDDMAYNMFNMDEAARARLRNFASWALFAAYWPLILLYAVWLPMTYMGCFKETASELEVRNRETFQARLTERKTNAGAALRPPEMSYIDHKVVVPGSLSSTINPMQSKA